MYGYYYVVGRAGESCGHHHQDLAAKVAKCRQRAGAGAHVWECDSVGRHRTLPAAALEPLRAFAPTRGRGRPAGQAPLTEQGKPLYARLSVAERQRFDAVAKRHDMELGEYALFLLEAAAQQEAASDGAAAPFFATRENTELAGSGVSISGRGK